MKKMVAALSKDGKKGVWPKVAVAMETENTPPQPQPMIFVRKCES